MLKIGLTGGIASGKSSVAKQLKDLGAVIIESDVLARQVVEPGTEGLDEIVARFGPKIVTADGSLNRSRLGEIVFTDDRARADLNRIVHPRVREATNRALREIPEGGVAVQVIPLLVETGQQHDFDKVVVVDVPESVQLERLMARNGLSREDAQARIAAQASRAERLAAADYVIENSGSFERTRIQVEELWRLLTEQP